MAASEIGAPDESLHGVFALLHLDLLFAEHIAQAVGAQEEAVVQLHVADLFYFKVRLPAGAKAVGQCAGNGKAVGFPGTPVIDGQLMHSAFSDMIQAAVARVETKKNGRGG